MNNTQNNKILYGIGGIVIGLILAGVFYPMMRYGSYGMMNWGYNSASNERNGNQVASNLDKHFIEQMIPHHEGAIAMANLALQKAKRPEVKKLATDIISAQTAEIQSMRGWYQDWFGSAVPKVNTGMMGGGMMSVNGMHMGGQEDISTLENASDFDTAFIAEMIPHHQLAIMMANMLLSGTNRPEMKQLANNIITSQTREIELMRSLAEAWAN